MMSIAPTETVNFNLQINPFINDDDALILCSIKSR